MNQLIPFLLATLLLPEVAGCQREADDARRSEAAPSAQRAPRDGQTSNRNWQVGTHYEVIEPAQGNDAGSHNVTVVEFFWYACVHCYALEGAMAAWVEAKPDYVEFERMPSQGRPVSKAHARLYYTLEALGREDLHARVFESVHERGNMLYSEDEGQTLRLQLEFAVAHGVERGAFLQAFRSDTVESALKRADQLLRSYRITGVPTVVVNGKYLTSLGRTEGTAEFIALITDLVAIERSR